MKKSANFVIYIVSALIWFSGLAQAQVWKDENTWSPEWERSFQDWVQTSWRTDFFSRRVLPTGEANPFFGLRTDCADTVYSMRIVFAYNNKLPFVAIDPTGGGNLISNRMTRWNSISSETRRIREFLLFAYDTFSTKSLPYDTYPVAISRETVLSGALMMTTARNHHSWTVQNILSIGVPHLIFNSTIGAGSGSGLQERTSWPNPEWVFQGNFTAAGHAGFRYWRQPQYLRTPVWQVPGYSEEQYQIPLRNWTDVVQKKLAVSHETEPQKIQRLMETACAGAQGRVAVVKEGLDFRASSGGRCMNYAEYDTYSSPNRDRRVFDDLIALRRAFRSLVEGGTVSALSEQTQRQLMKIYPAVSASVDSEQRQMVSRPIDSDSACVFFYGNGQQMDLAEYRFRAFAGLLSNNPHDGFEQRWGESPSHDSQRCTSWDAWSPDLRQEN
jgi:hypothetical protein